MLFSAAPLPILVQTASVDLPDSTTISTTEPVDLDDPQADATDSKSVVEHDASIRYELIFIDRSVEDYQQLINGIRDDHSVHFEMIELSNDRDGIEQVSAVLNGYDDLDAVHFVTHGTTGSVKLGNSWIDVDNLHAYAGQIANWNDSLRSGADLLIYGCNLAATEDGRHLAEAIGALCECDVAASNDDTGTAALGGDWELEYAAGAIETEVAFGADLQQNWAGLLTLQTLRDEFNSVSYSNNDGSVAWTNDWQEIGESNTPWSGNVQIFGALGEQGLQIWQNGKGAMREADLSAATSATLTFDYARFGLDDASDYIVIEVSANGGGSWFELDRFEGPANDSTMQSASYDISTYIASNTQIRFVTSGMNATESLFVDNVQIEYDDTQAPGGVVANLNLWLRADAGVSITGSNVNQWDNQVTSSPLTNVSASGSARPTFNPSTLNFNPVISFDGTNDHLSATSVLASTLFSSNASSIYTVTSLNNSSGVILQWEDNVLGTLNRVNVEDNLRFDFGHLINDQYTTASPAPGYHILNAVAAPGSPVQLSFNIDGQQTTPGNASGINPLALGNAGDFFLGEYPGGGFNDDTDLGEVIIFSSDLTAAEQARVDSYLAVKYGITLDQTAATNYVDSQGSIIWNATTNASYNNDLAGIGRDLTSTLDQSQSLSINSDAIVTMSAASDQHNREFLFWGNDDGALSEVAGEPVGILQRLGRIWRVDETGDVGTTTIELDLSGLTYTGTTAADFKLIIDSDTDFSSGASIVAAASYNGGTEIVTFTGVNLADAEYFVLGTSTLTANAPPTADATNGAPYVINEGDNTLMLDGSLSSDPESQPLTYAWDLDNDGIYGEAGEPTTATASVAWATLQSFGIDDDGSYTIGLRVTDDIAQFDTTTTTLTVNNTAPTLATTGAATINDGDLYTLNLSATDPGDDTITGWTINWGDGTIDTIVGNPPSATHTYNGAGFTYNITATATDEDDAWSSSDLIVGNWVVGSEDVHRFDGTTGAFDSVFMTSGGALNRPYSPIVGPDGNFYVSGYNSNNILQYDSSGNYLIEFVGSGVGLSQPDGLIFGPDSNLYVANFGGDNILRFNGSTGAFIDIFGSGGALNGPTGLAWGPDGDLYVSSWSNGRVVKFDGVLGGTPTTVINSGLANPEQIVFDAAGDLYIANGSGDNIRKWDGATLTTYFSDPSLNFATGLAFGPDGWLYVSSYNNDQILRYDGVTNEIFVTSGSGGLDQPEYLTFTPSHQVTVVSNLSPALDLDANDSSGASGNDYRFTYIEGDAPTSIADTDTDLVDADSTTFDDVTLAISGLLDGNAEVLVLDGSTFALATAEPGVDTVGLSYHVILTTGAGTANVTITKQGGGQFNESETETLIQAIRFQHTNTANPTDGNRLIDVTVNDGTNDSASARTTINVNPVNDAPSWTGNGLLTNIAEDNTNPPGDTITNLLGGQFNDVDPDAFDGIALIGNPANPITEGAWQYSTDSGATWFDVASVGDDATALALSTGSLLRFVPVSNYNGSPTSLVMRALDATYGAGYTIGAARANVDTTSNGGITAISGNTATVGTTVDPVNDAPSWLGNGTLANIFENDFNPPGDIITNIFAGRFSDIDTGSSFNGIAVISNGANPATEGAWQYSTDAGATWFDVAAVADGATALAVSSSDMLRFKPVAGFSGTPTALVARALDNTYLGGFTIGAGRVNVDTTTNGGVSSISGNQANINTMILPINSAPVLNPAATPVLNPTSEDAGPPIGAVGTLISSLVDLNPPLGGLDNVTDVDINPLTGIAITAADTTNGTWHYSIDGGTIWSALGAVANNNARLLASDANTRIYFQPTANYNGTVTGAITFRAWDQTSGVNGEIADASSSGGMFPFSTGSDTSDITVTPVNDAPTLSSFAGPIDATNEDTEVELTFAELAGPGDEADIDGSVVSFIVKSLGSGTLRIGASSATATAWVGGVNDTIDFANKAYWTPGSNANGLLNAFAVVAQDDAGAESIGNVTAQVQVNPVNDQPNAVGDSFSVDVDSTLSVAAQGVLANDVDVDGDPLTAVLLSGPAHGALVLNANGSFVYTPHADFTGTDSFRYAADDGMLNSNPVVVTITVNPIASPPPADPPPADPPPADPSPDDESPTAPDSPSSIDPVSADPLDSSSTAPTLGTGGSSILVGVPILPGPTEEVGEDETEPTDEVVFRKKESTKEAASPAESESTSPRNLDIRFQTENASLWHDLDELGERIDAAAQIPDFVIGSAASVTSTLTVGYVVWLIRGGQILAGMMAQMPAWQLMDPLPILATLDADEDDDEDDSLESLIEKHDDHSDSVGDLIDEA